MAKVRNDTIIALSQVPSLQPDRQEYLIQQRMNTRDYHGNGMDIEVISNNNIHIADPLLLVASTLNLRKEIILQEIKNGAKFQIEAGEKFIESGQYKVIITKESKLALQNSTKGLTKVKIVGKIVGGIGVGITIYDMTQNGINVNNSLDLVFGAIGTFGGPVGGTISILYFGGKMMIETNRELFKDKKYMRGWMLSDRHHF